MGWAKLVRVMLKLNLINDFIEWREAFNKRGIEWRSVWVTPCKNEKSVFQFSPYEKVMR